MVFTQQAIQYRVTLNTDENIFIVFDATNDEIFATGATIEEAIIIKLISEGLRDGDEIQQKSGLSASDFATALTILEINGVIKPLGANNWTLR